MTPDYYRGRRDALVSVLIFVLLGAAFVLFFVIYSLEHPQRAASAQELPQLKVTQLAGQFNQAWMDRRFCASIWWSKTDVCSEAKGDELGIGAGYKLDTYAAQAWVAVDGCTPTYCHLWIVEKLTNDKPGLSFVEMSGTVLLSVEPLTDVTPATITPIGVTLTPTGTRQPTITPTAPANVPWWQAACQNATSKALFITAGNSLVIPKREAGEGSVCLIVVKVDESRLDTLLDVVSDTIYVPISVGIYAP